MVNDKFWEVIKKYNNLMRSAIQGPNCLDICKGDCCSIKINVPKALAEEYIKRGYADKNDFIRSNTFSFQLRFDEKKGKCFLFDKDVNGCLVHNSGIKPPQCWIYPTNFSNPEDKEISCKKAKGWKISDQEKTKKAEELLKYYIFLCQLEAKKEFKELSNRLNNRSSKNRLIALLRDTSPSQLAGFRDTWDKISTLSAEGISLQMKKFCEKYNQNCGTNYLFCRSICDKLIDVLLLFLQQNLFKYVKMNGLDQQGHYTFLKLSKN
ncbi:MAG: YkgJ family cysteine cluster protein [Promethearchaeota archaeon]